MSQQRRGYPSDVTDEEWAFCAPYLTLMREDAAQRDYPLRELFNGVRYVVRTGCQWRYLPHDFPAWTAVYQQGRRWWTAKCFETMAHDLREMLRVVAGRLPDPTAAVLDSRTLSSTPESGERAGYDGHKRRNGSKPFSTNSTKRRIPTPTAKATRSSPSCPTAGKRSTSP